MRLSLQGSGSQSRPPPPALPPCDSECSSSTTTTSARVTNYLHCDWYYTHPHNHSQNSTSKYTYSHITAAVFPSTHKYSPNPHMPPRCHPTFTFTFTFISKSHKSIHLTSNIHQTAVAYLSLRPQPPPGWVNNIVSRKHERRLPLSEPPRQAS
jgi:hypothetical protein